MTRFIDDIGNLSQIKFRRMQRIERKQQAGLAFTSSVNARKSPRQLFQSVMAGIFLLFMVPFYLLLTVPLLRVSGLSLGSEIPDTHDQDHDES